MRALRTLLAEARAHNLLRPLAFDALAMALAFAVLAFLWIATSPSGDPAAPAVPTHASATGDSALAAGVGQ